MNSYQATIHQKIYAVEDGIQKLSNTIHALKSTDMSYYPANYEELSTNAALRAERITCQLRNLVYGTNVTKKMGYMSQATQIHSIEINLDNHILSIKLPGLLPKRKVHTNGAFLHEPLDFALKTYLRANNLQLYSSCMVCFSQVYNRDMPKHRVRDFDNIEFKQILDTIATHFLVDDSGLLCDTYHTMEFGEADYTHIFVMEKPFFPYWLKDYKKL